jgi:hypothetical protein
MWDKWTEIHKKNDGFFVDEVLNVGFFLSG